MSIEKKFREKLVNDVLDALQPDVLTHGAMLEVIGEVLMRIGQRSNAIFMAAAKLAMPGVLAEIATSGINPGDSRRTKPVDPVSETDWGQGVGGREKPIDPQAFRDELSDLRDRTTEKRNRRGMP